MNHMHEIFGLPQALTGAETVTIRQEQNGEKALCTMPLSDLIALIGSASSTAWAVNLPTTLPAVHGVVWNDNGVISLS